MNNFWSSFFGSAIGTAVAFVVSGILSLFIFIGLLGSLGSAEEVGQTAKHVENSILTLKLDYEIPELTSEDPFSGFSSGNFNFKKSIGLSDILNSIKYAKTDEKIKGIRLLMSDCPSGVATLCEIRNALIDFKNSGKFIYAYGDIYSQKAYYVASAADKIYMNPQGEMNFMGLSAKFISIRGTLEKIGVKAEIIRPDSNKFKSAVEPFIYDKMSDPNREQTSRYLNSVWSTYLDDVSASRKINKDRLNIIADEMLTSIAEVAVKEKLLDDLKYTDEFDEEIRTKIGAEKETKLNYLNVEDYYKIAKQKLKGDSENKIAVVVAEGEIVYGKGSDGQIGSTGMSESIHKAAADKDIKAIVLRVNSPGGSALASEIIWRAVVKAKEKKPVIVSMGNLAASGGYYISAPADVIVAEPVTLTGSIGVFGILFNAEKLLKEHIGLNTDTVKTNAHSDFGSGERPLNEFEREVLRKNVNNTYQTFLKRVSDGRKLTIKQVDEIAQGRVWTGKDAKELKLVDELGGLDKALEIAAKKAEISDYEIEYFPKEENPILKIIGADPGEEMSKKLLVQLKKELKVIGDIQKIKNLKGSQVRLSVLLEIN
jgi:protease-4